MIKNIGAVFIYVSKLERSIGFYEQLGLKSRGIEKWDSGERGAVLLFPEENGSHILLWETKNIPKHDRPLFNLVCNGVEKLYTKLNELGIPGSEINQWDSEWHHHLDFDVFDPDGHAINIIEITKK
jgi:lactoylglutathione lyase